MSVTAADVSMDVRPVQTDKKVSAKATHPSYPVMIKQAIEADASRHGTSRQMIANYINANYTLNGKQSSINHRLRNALVRGTEDGLLTQTKGNGANGSFKLTAAKAVVAKVTAPKKAAAKKTVAAEKKSKSPKKKTPKAKSTAAKSPKKVTKMTKAAKSPKKATKSPKKVAAAKSPKKATPSKSTKVMTTPKSSRQARGTRPRAIKA